MKSPIPWCVGTFLALSLVASNGLIMGQTQVAKPPAQATTEDNVKKEEKKGPEKFEADIVKLEKTPKPLSPDTVLFVGSSMIRLWKVSESFPNQKVVNFGFGGSRISDLNHFFTRIILPYQPRRVVVYGGDNDLNEGTPPEVIAKRVDDFLNRVEKELPGTKVIWLAVKPSPSRIKLFEAQKYTNSLLEFVCSQHKCAQFVDTFSAVLADQNHPKTELYDKDQLHFNDAGYAVWNQLVGAKLSQTNRPPVSPATDSITRLRRIFPVLPGRKKILPWRNP